MSKIVTDLNKLTPEELASVSRLIAKFASRHENGSQEKRQDSRVDKKPRRNDHKDLELETEAEVGRSHRNRRIILDDEPEPTTNHRRSGRGRTKPTEHVHNNKGRRSGGVATRTEVVGNVGKENKFLAMTNRGKRIATEAEKRDTKIDELLWGENEPTARPPKFKPVEVQCKVCNRYFDINPSLVFIDPDTDEAIYTCDNCTKRG